MYCLLHFVLTRFSISRPLAQHIIYPGQQSTQYCVLLFRDCPKIKPIHFKPPLRGRSVREQTSNWFFFVFNYNVFELFNVTRRIRTRVYFFWTVCKRFRFFTQTGFARSRKIIDDNNMNYTSLSTVRFSRIRVPRSYRIRSKDSVLEYIFVPCYRLDFGALEDIWKTTLEFGVVHRYYLNILLYRRVEIEKYTSRCMSIVYCSIPHGVIDSEFRRSTGNLLGFRRYFWTITTCADYANDSLKWKLTNHICLQCPSRISFSERRDRYVQTEIFRTKKNMSFIIQSGEQFRESLTIKGPVRTAIVGKPVMFITMLYV